MTLEQRVRRAEKMLVMMANSGRRTRSEWRYKIDGLIHAHMTSEAEAREQKESINMLIQSQMETSEQIRDLKASQAETSEQIRDLAASHQKVAAAQAELTAAQIELTHSQKLTDRTLRDFIESLRRGDNGSSSH